MIRKFIRLYNKFIIKFLIIFKKKENLIFNFEELNFKLINFNDQRKIKLVYWNFKEIQKNIKDDKSLLFHSFEWLDYSKKLGGANNIKKSNNIIESWIKKNNSTITPLWSINLISSRFVNLV